MKTLSLLLTTAITLTFVLEPLYAQERRGGNGGGGGRSSGTFKSHGGSSNFKRSPMTNSRMNRSQPTRISRPTQRVASKPVQRPVSKPIQRPTVQKPKINRPASKPEIKRPNNPKIRKPEKPNIIRPDNKGRKPDISRKPDINRPGNRTDNKRPNGNKPGTNNRIPNNRQDNRPSLNRPNGNKKNTLPGMVTYPAKAKRGNNDKRPNLANRNGQDRKRPDGKRPNGQNRDFKNNKPNKNFDRDWKKKNGGKTIVNRGDNNRINVGDRNRNRVHIDRVNVNRRNRGLNRPGNLPSGRHNWDSKRWGGNNSVWGDRVNIGNNVNVHVNNRYRNNNNFACRPNYWGSRPWWGSGNYHRWHGGHWNYGWNHHHYHRHWYYNDNEFASGFMWGIGVWSLGNLVYDMGYNRYRNPYTAPPVQNTYINYSEPISVAAAANPPGDENTAAIAEEKSDTALEQSREAFLAGNYLSALEKCDEALTATPGDGTLHEYRALIFFALGKYGEAAGTLNPVLASGPGWGWDTMITFYNSSETYSSQLERLQDYTEKTDAAECHFLLGYHYLVCGYMEEANAEFSRAAELQPADTISPQLRDLTKSSIAEDEETETTPEPRPEPIPVDQLVGTWVNQNETGTVTFTMKESGDYNWKFAPKGGSASELAGTYGLDDKGLLVLTSDETQMVSVVEMKEPGKMHFMLVGAPDGDPGLHFTKS